MIIDACGVSHRGNIRKHNEDNLYVDGTLKKDLAEDNVIVRSKRTSAPYVYGVFDGLGGEACGEQASLIAAMGLEIADERDIAQMIDAYIFAANRAVLREARKNNVRTMGSTAAVVVINEETATVCSVGDSRVYLLRDNGLEQLTRDHSVVQSMIDNGFLRETDRHNSRYSGELTQYLGMTSEDDIEPSADTISVTLAEKDILLLCTDGLTNELDDEEIRSVLVRNRDQSAEYIAVDLVKETLNKSCTDNVTAVICKTERL